MFGTSGPLPIDAIVDPSFVVLLALVLVLVVAVRLGTARET